MREILFKARRIDNGEWIEGLYVVHVDKRTCFASDLRPKNIHHLIVRDGFCDWGFEPPLCSADIDPETLCQYTGMIDKKGKRIWEGSTCLIIRKCSAVPAKITWIDGCFWALDGYGTLIRLCDLEKNDYEIEVIS